MAFRAHKCSLMLSSLKVLTTKAIVAIPITNWIHYIGQNGTTIIALVERLFILWEKKDMFFLIFLMVMSIR